MAGEPRRVSHEPLFAGLYNVEVDDTVLKELYKFSQNKTTTATFYFPDMTSDPNEAPGPGLNMHGFRSIVSYALVRALTNVETAFITPLITMLSDSILYNKGATNTTVSKKINKSFYGILDYKNFHTAYNKQTAKQADINAKAGYTNAQKDITDMYKLDREILLHSYNSKYISQKLNMNQRANFPLYKLKTYDLFSPESRSDFINTTNRILTASSNLKLILIPLGIYPFNYTSLDTDGIHVKTIGHAQYIFINTSKKMYTIIDGQMDTSKTTYEDMRIQLQKLDPLIEEIMGEPYEPYLYSVKCPQAIVVDNNCIWWSMLVVFLFLQSDPNTANYGTILLELNRTANGDKEFLTRVLNSFKMYILETLATILNDGRLTWPDLDYFFTMYMPVISPNSRPRVIEYIAQARAAYEADPYEAIVRGEELENYIGRRVYYNRNARQSAAREAAARAERASMPILRRNTTLGGPAMIGPIAVGGRTRKLKTHKRRHGRTHKYTHGKLLRKSSRRARY